jgi:predicted transcriptional regulator
MDSVYRRGSATVTDIQGDLPDPPGYSAVRAMLRTLVEKGHLKHEWDGPRYLYRPTVPRESARESALKRLVATFFDGSEASTIAALLDRGAADMGEDELARLAEMIEDARRRGR